jgi:hypothetical protein
MYVWMYTYCIKYLGTVSTYVCIDVYLLYEILLKVSAKQEFVYVHKHNRRAKWMLTAQAMLLSLPAHLLVAVSI